MKSKESSRWEWIQDEFDPLMRASELRELLDCGERQVYDILERAEKEGFDLKVKINKRSIRVVRDAVIEWLNDGGFAENGNGEAA